MVNKDNYLLMITYWLTYVQWDAEGKKIKINDDDDDNDSDNNHGEV